MADAGMIAVIPSARSRKVPIPHDAELDKTRNHIERCFNKLKHFRRFATPLRPQRSLLPRFPPSRSTMI